MFDAAWDAVAPPAADVTFAPVPLGPCTGSPTPKSMPGLLALMWKIWEGFWIWNERAPTVNGACAAVAPRYLSSNAPTVAAPPTGS